MGPLCDLCGMPHHPSELREWGRLLACDACIEWEARKEALERAKAVMHEGYDLAGAKRERASARKEMGP